MNLLKKEVFFQYTNLLLLLSLLPECVSGSSLVKVSWPEKRKRIPVIQLIVRTTAYEQIVPWQVL